MQEIGAPSQDRQLGAQFARDVHHEMGLLLERERHALIFVLQVARHPVEGP